MELLLGVSTFFARFAVAGGISSGKGDHTWTFFPVEIKMKILKYLVSQKPNINESEYSMRKHQRSGTVGQIETRDSRISPYRTIERPESCHHQEVDY